MTRGKAKKIRSLTLSGNVYLKYEILPEQEFNPGDIMVYINNDSISYIKGSYYNSGYSGYLKLNIYDGREWQHIIESEFFEHKENFFSKKEYPIDTYNLIKEIIEGKAGELVYRTYRSHYSTYLHEMNVFKGKKSQVQ